MLIFTIARGIYATLTQPRFMLLTKSSIRAHLLNGVVFLVSQLPGCGFVPLIIVAGAASAPSISHVTDAVRVRVGIWETGEFGPDGSCMRSEEKKKKVCQMNGLPRYIPRSRVIQQRSTH